MLECDLGGLSDVLAPKRSSLRAGLVEVNMFLKINKHFMPSNSDDVVRLDGIWEIYIPKRPIMHLYDGEDAPEQQCKSADGPDDNFMQFC